MRYKDTLLNRKNMKYAILVIAIIGIYNFLFASMDVHYKLTINVETPEGIKSGYAVREVTNWASRYDPIGWPEGGNPADIRGEAVVVDLGERGVLFGLINSGSERELYYTFPSERGAATYQGIKHYDSLDAGLKSDVPKHYWPKMVTFTDMNDPKTVTSVLRKAYCPSSDFRAGKCPVKNANYFVDNVESVFGKGVKIQSVTVEITDEDVTKTGILERLPKFDEEFWKWRKALPHGHVGKISRANFNGRF